MNDVDEGRTEALLSEVRRHRRRSSARGLLAAGLAATIAAAMAFGTIKDLEESLSRQKKIAEALNRQSLALSAELKISTLRIETLEKILLNRRGIDRAPAEQPEDHSVPTGTGGN